MTGTQSPRRSDTLGRALALSNIPTRDRAEGVPAAPTTQPIAVALWNHSAHTGRVTALTIKGVDENVVRRIAGKASAAGVSMQEYVRQLLARDAQLRSADEMVELQRARRATASEPEAIDAAVARQAGRRRTALDR